MKQWFTLYNKEMLEMARSAKWLWLPLVFAALGIMQPVTTYYMPQLLESMGGLPEGAVIQIPVPSPPEVLVSSLSQFGSIGVLILVLASMAAVSGERASGVAAMVMMKPVPHVSYISSKWAGLLTLTLASFAVGYGGSWYYTELLFGPVEPGKVFSSFFVYALWLVFIVTLTLLMSSLLKANGAIAFVSVGTATALSIAGGMFAKAMRWSPGALSGHAGALLMEGKGGAGLAISLTASCLLVAALLAAAVLVFKRKPLTPA